MTRYTCTLLLMLIGFGSFSQLAYRDVLREHRRKYKADLYEVIKGDTAFIRFYPADESVIVDAEVTLLTGEQPFRITTSSGKSKEAQRYARLRFRLKGKTHSLFVYQLLQLKEKEETAGDLFLPFTDFSSGKGSYGGGRYIDAHISDISNGRMKIDFNKAYNPYCAFTTGYNCPIPPRENNLPVFIKAGERYLEGKFSHQASPKGAPIK